MIDTIALEAFELLGTGRQTSPFSHRHERFTLADAYRTTLQVRRLREGRDEHPIGRKIGFTNRTIWSEYQVFAPIWGYMYDKTVHNLSDLADGFSLAGLSEPRIEPEIAFHSRTLPSRA
jgi:2-oxo-3-hexenedioate decarboxylase